MIASAAAAASRNARLDLSRASRTTPRIQDLGAHGAEHGEERVAVAVVDAAVGERLPRERSSSPVEKKATRTRRRTPASTVPRMRAPRAPRGPPAVPRRGPPRPGQCLRPPRATLSPARGRSSSRTAPPGAALAFSWITTASAPAGITAPGHDAHALAGPHRAGEGPAGPGGSEHAEHRRAVTANVGGAHRVSVHGRVVVRGDVGGGVDRCGEHPAESLPDRHPLDSGDRGGKGVDALERLLHEERGRVEVVHAGGGHGDERIRHRVEPHRVGVGVGVRKRSTMNRATRSGRSRSRRGRASRPPSPAPGEATATTKGSSTSGASSSRRTAILGTSACLKPSTSTMSTDPQSSRSTSSSRVGSRGRVDLGDERPAPARADEGLHRPGQAQLVAVLPRLVDVERVVGMLDRRDPEAGAGEGAHHAPLRASSCRSRGSPRTRRRAGAAFGCLRRRTRDAARLRLPTPGRVRPRPARRPRPAPPPPVEAERAPAASGSFRGRTARRASRRLRSSSRFTLRKHVGEIGEVDDLGLLLFEPAVDLAFAAGGKASSPESTERRSRTNTGCMRSPSCATATLASRTARAAWSRGPSDGSTSGESHGTTSTSSGGRGFEGARHARERALKPAQPVRDYRVAVAGVAVGAAVRVDRYRPCLPLHRGEDVLDHGPAGHLHQPLVGAAHPRAAPPGEDHPRLPIREDRRRGAFTARRSGYRPDRRGRAGERKEPGCGPKGRRRKHISAADVGHSIRGASAAAVSAGERRAGGGGAKLGVAVVTAAPDAGETASYLAVGGARAQQRPQVVAGSGDRHV